VIDDQRVPVGAGNVRPRAVVRWLLYLALAGVVWCLVAAVLPLLPTPEGQPRPDIVRYAFLPGALLCALGVFLARFRSGLYHTLSLGTYIRREVNEDLLRATSVSVVRGVPRPWRVAAGLALLASLVLLVLSVINSSPGTLTIEDGEYLLRVGEGSPWPLTWDKYLSIQRWQTWFRVSITLPLYVITAVLAAGLWNIPKNLARAYDDRRSRPA